MHVSMRARMRWCACTCVFVIIVQLKTPTRCRLKTTFMDYSSSKYATYNPVRAHSLTHSHILLLTRSITYLGTIFYSLVHTHARTFTRPSTLCNVQKPRNSTTIHTNTQTYSHKTHSTHTTRTHTYADKKLSLAYAL